MIRSILELAFVAALIVALCNEDRLVAWEDRLLHNLKKEEVK